MHRSGICLDSGGRMVGRLVSATHCWAGICEGCSHSQGRCVVRVMSDSQGVLRRVEYLSGFRSAQNGALCICKALLHSRSSVFLVLIFSSSCADNARLIGETRLTKGEIVRSRGGMKTVHFQRWAEVLATSDLSEKERAGYKVTIRWYLSWCRHHSKGGGNVVGSVRKRAVQHEKVPGQEESRGFRERCQIRCGKR